MLDTGAENQLCPTGAITRKYIDKKGGVRYFEYTIDEGLCIACGKCVVGCRLMNGSLFLQVRHDRCLNCNECSIAVGLPGGGLSPRAGRVAAVAASRGPAAEEALARQTGGRTTIRKRFASCVSMEPDRKSETRNANIEILKQIQNAKSQ